MRMRLESFVMVMVVAVGLGGCASSPDGDEVLTVWIMQGATDSAEEFFDDVGETFAQQTGARLRVEYVHWGTAHERFVNAIAGNTTPDVAETGTTWTSEFAAAGALRPIGDDVQAAGLSDDLVEGLVASGTYDGQLYGMPWYAGVRSLVYRTDVFEDLGLTAPTTWQEIIDTGTAIKQARPDLIPFPVPGDAEFTAYPWVWGAGGDIATEGDGGWMSDLAGASSREGIEFWTGLARDHDFSTAGATTWKEIDVLDNFVDGRVAMALMGSWNPPTIFDRNPALEGKLAATPIPGKDGGMSPSVIGGSHLSVFNTARNPDLAFEFITMVSTGEYATRWAELTGYFPGQQSLLEGALSSSDPLLAPFAEQFVNGGRALPSTPAFGAVQAEKTIPTMIQAILSGKKTVDAATDEAVAVMNNTLNR